MLSAMFLLLPKEIQEEIIMWIPKQFVITTIMLLSKGIRKLCRYNKRIWEHIRYIDLIKTTDQSCDNNIIDTFTGKLDYIKVDRMVNHITLLQKPSSYPYINKALY